MQFVEIQLDTNETVISSAPQGGNRSKDEVSILCGIGNLFEN